MTRERIKIRAVAARKLLDEKLAANLTSLFAWSNFIRQFPWSSCHSSIKFHTCLVGTEMEMGKENYYTKGMDLVLCMVLYCNTSEFNDPIQHDTLLMPTLAKKCHIIIIIIIRKKLIKKNFKEWWIGWDKFLPNQLF